MAIPEDVEAPQGTSPGHGHGMMCCLPNNVSINSASGLSGDDVQGRDGRCGFLQWQVGRTSKILPGTSSTEHCSHGWSGPTHYCYLTPLPD